MKKYGFIGAGNMGSALSVAVAKKCGSSNVLIYDKSIEKATLLAESIGSKASSLNTLLSECDYVFLAVKPQVIEMVAEEISSLKSCIKSDVAFVTMLAGTSISKINSLIGDYPVIRIMPNVACSVGKGVVLCSSNSKVSENTLSEFLDSMEYSGLVDVVDEKMIDAAACVSGCAPAYVFMMIEALADGAVTCGVPRDKAYAYAAGVLEGSAKLFAESGRSPSELKDSVCSPSGTTIEGVRVLEKNDFRSSMIEAVVASYNRTKEINNGKK